jgi:hypothetical protein
MASLDQLSTPSNGADHAAAIATGQQFIRLTLGEAFVLLAQAAAQREQTVGPIQPWMKALKHPVTRGRLLQRRDTLYRRLVVLVRIAAVMRVHAELRVIEARLVVIEARLVVSKPAADGARALPIAA